MKKITEIYEENIYTSSTYELYFGGLKACTLDIETTGLNPAQNKFILGGIYDFQTKTMEQYFAQSRQEEEETLVAFLERVCQFDMVVTYNGRHFDLPFLEKRMVKYGLNYKLPYNLDLYLVVNGHSPIKKLVPNLKQKTVENYMGLWQDRTDEISGAESVELYNRYENTGRADLEEKILLHNSDDVVQLTRLMKVLSKCDVHKAMYHLGFPAGPLMVEKLRTESGWLVVSGKQHGISMDYMGFTFGDWPCESKFDSRSGEFMMKLPIIRDSGLCFVDLEASGVAVGEFEKYPTCSSGFLVLEDHNDRNFMETNHFVKAFVEMFIEKI